jgi:hypothetical protein
VEIPPQIPLLFHENVASTQGAFDLSITQNEPALVMFQVADYEDSVAVPGIFSTRSRQPSTISFRLTMSRWPSSLHDPPRVKASDFNWRQTVHARDIPVALKEI